MEGYTKLFQSLLASSIWAEDDRTRLVWVTMLAMRNSRHEVEASVSGLAHMARVPVEDCRAALSKFMGPDPDSRDREYDGRRIEEVPGGWKILNGDKYSRKMSNEERKEYFRNYQRERRAKQAEKKGGNGKAPPALEFKPPTWEEVWAIAQRAGGPEHVAKEFFDFWTAEKWTTKDNLPKTQWKGALTTKIGEWRAAGRPMPDGEEEETEEQRHCRERGIHNDIAV